MANHVDVISQMKHLRRYSTRDSDLNLCYPAFTMKIYEIREGLGAEGSMNASIFIY